MVITKAWNSAFEGKPNFLLYKYALKLVQQMQLDCRHGNFVETVPLGLVLIGIAEMQAAFPEWALMILSTALVAGRYFHAYAFIGGLPIPRHLRFRVIGMVTTVTAILTTGGLVCFGSIKQFLA